jgi:hypothetical protein
MDKRDIDPKVNAIKAFERLRRRCVDHFRALASVQAAHQYISKLIENEDSLDEIMSSALHSASVIAYARPFTSAKTNTGSVQYPVKQLKEEPGFDLELHEHLIKLRNRIVAHSDYSMLRSTMYLQAVGDLQELPVSLGINVKRLRGIESRELANRYNRHFAACIAQIAKTFDSEFNELARHVRVNPKYFEDTQNLPLQRTEHGAIPSLTPMPRPHGPSGDVEEPEFPDGLSGYKYEKLTHQRALVKSGTYKVLVNGILQEYTFKIDGPEID